MTAFDYMICEHIKKKERIRNGTATFLDYMEMDPIDMLNMIQTEAKK